MNKQNGLALALGFFDGLHIAHRAVLNAALEQKQYGLTPAVLLFDEHPYQALTGNKVERLMTDADRRATLEQMGFRLTEISFRGIKDLSPAAFVQDLLKETYGCAFVSCGYNYTFGAGGKGDAAALVSLCGAAGIRTTVCGRIRQNGADVCSSAIRQALKNGDPETAAEMLGRPFSFSAPVFHGDGRGEKLGFPTANQFLPEGLLVPKFGVYASLAETENGNVYPAVTNIGCRPTFNGESVRSETCLRGFSGNLYGTTVRISLYAFLREEQKFPSFDALRQQIAIDAAQAEQITGAIA